MAPPAGMEMFSLAQALAQPSPSPVIQNRLPEYLTRSSGKANGKSPISLPRL